MRMDGYDYSRPGAYFVTACTRNRELLFESPEAQLAVESAWFSLTGIFADIKLDEFVVMPNHIHCIVCIQKHGCYRLHPGIWKIDGICRDGQLPIPTNAINFPYPRMETITTMFLDTDNTVDVIGHDDEFIQFDICKDSSQGEPRRFNRQLRFR